MQTKTITIEPTLLPSLHPLARALANFAWSYEPALVQLRALFEKKVTVPERTTPFSALLRLGTAEQEQLAKDTALQAQVQQAIAVLDQKPQGKHLGSKDLVAYFSAEYGIHEALPIYAGGLGILSGDHLKSASDLGLPLVAVGLFYRLGYHEQTIAGDMNVHERYLENDPQALGAKLCTFADGSPVTVHVRLPGRLLHVQAWELLVGRTSLYLLDTNISQNNEADRRITERLYGGDNQTRIEQELVLGVAGVFMLEALGKKPSVYHMNEGHAAFLTLARLHVAQRDHGLTLDEAHELVAASQVFTTHTPIAAGNDVFTHGLLSPYLLPLCDSLRLPLSWVFDLGSENTGRVDNHPEARFSMTAFALRSAEFRNGVSVEHGAVSRRLWQPIWPGLVGNEVPIGAIVNGVHMRTWSHPMMQKHYKADKVDHAAFWKDKRALRQDLLNRVNTNRPPDRRFSADVLTLGFARRFAEYKRALLLFSNPERLRRLLDNAERPVQLLFAGKAHPNNQREKANIKALHEIIARHGLDGRVAFIENYDMLVARSLVQGVDVWLNLPRPPLEASGTSGMKIVENGGLNVSVRDGWWKEAYEPGLGWAVGEIYDELAPQDDASRDIHDTRDLYRVIEDEVAPLFYTRDAQGVPREWIDRCINSGKKLAGYFDATRMVDAYAKMFYAPASHATPEEAKKRAANHQRVLSALDQARVEWVDGPVATGARKVALKARITAQGLSPSDFAVDAIAGRALSQDSLPYNWHHTRVQAMTVEPQGDGRYLASCEFEPASTGTIQFALRLLPRTGSGRLVHRVIFA